MIWHPLPSPRSPRVGFPGFNGIMGCSDFSSSIPGQPLASPRSTSVSLGFGYLRLGVCFASPSRSPRNCDGCSSTWSGSPLDLRGLSLRRRQRDLPGSWAALAHVPRSQTPGETQGPTTWPLVAAFRQHHAVGLPICSFRGSVARPMCFLCTLHRGGHPTRRNTRFQMAVNLVWAGLKPAGLQRGFDISTSSSSSPGLAWRTMVPIRWWSSRRNRR